MQQLVLWASWSGWWSCLCRSGVRGESKTQGRSSGVPASTHLYWLCDHCNLHPCCLCWLVERFYFPFIRANLHKSRHWDHGAFAASSWGCLTILVQLSLVVLLGSRSQAIPACAVPGLTAFLLDLAKPTSSSKPLCVTSVAFYCVLYSLFFMTAPRLPSNRDCYPTHSLCGVKQSQRARTKPHLCSYFWFLAYVPC